jgi:1-pyrroline-5-carboxylate dehydrogenase
MPTASPPDRRIESALSEVRTAAYEVPNLIGGEEVRTGRWMPVVTPHAHAVTLGRVHCAGPAETTTAIEAALAASGAWGRRSPEERTAPFVRAADLLERSPWRERLVAATMLALSKTALQAEGDVIAESADMIRAGVANFLAVADVQPDSPDGVRNHLDYRPLEGFVFAVSPFNYASMNHLALGPALLGNVVVWKPAEATALVSHLMLSLLRAAGLPDGVINLVHGDGAEIGEVALAHRDLAAVHFTGSTATFRHLFRAVGANVDRYRGYPRVVGETGGKGFVLAHASADLTALTEAVVDGAFDYQGQKCSAASRLYVPRSVWPAFRDRLVARTEALTVGDPTVPGTDLGAVITSRQFAKHADALARARADRLVLTGGSTDDRVGWFVRPTVLQVADPKSWPMTEELFAPVTAAYVYDDAEWEATLQLVDDSTPYGLTGAVFGTDDRAIVEADQALRYTAGNLTINDKPTGAVVGQQPFGGARASGTNDKIGTVWSSIRFLSPRSVKRREG